VTVKRLSISLDSELADLVQSRAEASSEAVSAWLAEAARRRVRQDELLAAVHDFEREHGVISEKELTASRRRLGIDMRGSASRRSA
jgi:hypothetical protein